MSGVRHEGFSVIVPVMETFLLAVDSVYGLIFVAAAVLAALQSQRDIRLARGLVIVGATLMAARWSVWALTTEANWMTRGAVGALIGATLFILVPSAIHWLSDRIKPENSATEAQPDKPPAKAAAELLKLEDLFRSDFGFLSVDSVINTTINIPLIQFQTTIDIPLRIFKDFSSNTEFVSIYIPLFGDARLSQSIEGVVERLKDQIKQSRENSKTIEIATGFPGSVTRSQDLVFSGRVFIYTLNTLDAVQIGKLVESYRRDGMFLEFRGADYLFYRTRGQSR